MGARTRRRTCTLTVAVALAVCAALAPFAHAENASARQADDLFTGGKELMAQKDYAHACPLLAQSYQLDPATGTLLALALCHEREGKLGTAFREYSEAVLRAQREARPDRESAAREKSQALEPRLSTLTIKLATSQPRKGLEVRLNGKALDPAQLGRAIPVDGGTQRIEASAPGKKTWQGELAIAESIDAKTMNVPALENAAPSLRRAVTRSRAGEALAASGPEPRAPAHEFARDSGESSSGLSTTQWVGIGIMSGGAIALGVGSYFALRAIAKNKDSNAGCDGDLCTAAARQVRLDARAAGSAASVAFIAGGALAGAGLVVYLAGSHAASAERAAIAASPWTDGRALGASLHGSF